MCGATTHAVPNRPKPRACLRLTPYHPTNTASVATVFLPDGVKNTVATKLLLVGWFAPVPPKAENDGEPKA